MDDSEDEGRYSHKPSSVYSLSSRSRRTIRNHSSYPRNGNYNKYKNEYEYDDTEDSDEGEDDPEFNGAENGYDIRNKKKRKMESLVSNYEFAPRTAGNSQGPAMRGSGSSRGWSEEDSFMLLDVWGERYLELGRRSLRGEDWVDVAEKVSEMIGVEKGEIDCRNQLDVLKKKYKKEREKMEKMGGAFSSKWSFFKKMDVLMNLRMKGHCGLGCGVDSGEYVFMDPRMYLDRSNVMDEMRDSPAGSDIENEEGKEEVGGEAGWGEEDEESAKLLAESIQRFGDIYEKIENSKRKQMMELEEMRWDFQRDLEMQKKQIVERAQAEIAKIRDSDGSSGDDGDGEDDGDDNHKSDYDDDGDDDDDGNDDDDDDDEDNVSTEKLNG